jgi:hypothetical protein
MKSSHSFRKAGGSARGETSTGKWKVVVGVVAAILLVSGSVWAYIRNRPDPEVEQVKQALTDAFKEGQRPNFQLMQQMRQQTENFTQEQRHQVWEFVRQQGERRMDKQMDAFFALPQKARVAELDKQIKEMEKRRKEMEARRAQGGGGQRGPGGFGMGPGGGGPQMAQGGPGGGGGPGVGPGGGQRPPRDTSPKARATRRNQRLDSSTPEQRAKRSAYRSAMQQRRVELGLPVQGPGGPRGPR